MGIYENNIPTAIQTLSNKLVLENTQASELDLSLALEYANRRIPRLASTPCIFDKTTNNELGIKHGIFKTPNLKPQK